MDSREALRRLRAKRQSKTASDHAAQNPLFQVLKGIVGLLGPLIAVYYGNFFLARSTADEFARNWMTAIAAGHYADVYKMQTDDAFKASETEDGFQMRMRGLGQSYGKLRNLNIALFDLKLVGGSALLQYDAEFQSRKAKLNFLLARGGLSRWKTARFVVNEWKR